MLSGALWCNQLLLTRKSTEGHGVVGDKDSLVGAQVCPKPGNTERPPPQHSLVLHRLICQHFPKRISFTYMQDATSALSADHAVEATGRGEQLLHFHCAPTQSGQLLDRTWLTASMLRPLRKPQIQEPALV